MIERNSPKITLSEGTGISTGAITAPLIYLSDLRGHIAKATHALAVAGSAASAMRPTEAGWGATQSDGGGRSLRPVSKMIYRLNYTQ